jgi:hypothetical protein
MVDDAQNRSWVCVYLELFAFSFLVSCEGMKALVRLRTVENHARSCYMFFPLPAMVGTCLLGSADLIWTNLVMLLFVCMRHTCIHNIFVSMLSHMDLTFDPASYGKQ